MKLLSLISDGESKLILYTEKRKYNLTPRSEGWMENIQEHWTPWWDEFFNWAGETKNRNKEISSKFNLQEHCDLERGGCFPYMEDATYARQLVINAFEQQKTSNLTK